MRAKKRAFAAAGFAALTGVGTIPIWMWLVPSAASGKVNLGLVVLFAVGAVVNLLAIGLLAVPVLTGRGARHQEALASLSIFALGSLLFLDTIYGLGVLFEEVVTGLPSVLVAVGVVAVPMSLGFAVATGVGAAPRREGKGADHGGSEPHGNTTAVSN
jgi:hypothetical protein